MIWNESTKMLRKWRQLLLPKLLHNVAHNIAPPVHYHIHHTAWADACKKLALSGRMSLQCQIVSSCSNQANHGNICGFHW